MPCKSNKGQDEQKLREKDELISDLRAQIESLNRNLSEKVSQMSDMMDKLVSFMMGRREVTLSDSLRDTVISGVRAEYGWQPASVAVWDR